jgi:Ni/Co efflux regulator RcnB
MKTFRPLLALTAALVVAALPIADAAAQGRGRERGDNGDRGGRGRWEQVQQRGDQGRPRGRGPDGAGPPGQMRRQHEAPPQQQQRRYDRGGYLPPDSGDRVGDPSRYRLREPPRGYDWVRMGDRYMMVDRRTGQIFDVVR